MNEAVSELTLFLYSVKILIIVISKEAAGIKRYYRYSALTIITAAVLFGLAANVSMPSERLTQEAIESFVVRLTSEVLPSGDNIIAQDQDIDSLLKQVVGGLNLMSSKGFRYSSAVLIRSLKSILSSGIGLTDSNTARSDIPLTGLIALSAVAGGIAIKKLRELLLERSVIAE